VAPSTVGEQDIDLGEGHSLRWILASPEFVHEETDANLHNWDGGAYTLVGATLLHDNDSGERCKATISFVLHTSPHEDHPEQVWMIQSTEPLEISPAIECEAEGCSLKGQVRDGQFEED
jgi:hypothetical protein